MSEYNIILSNNTLTMSSREIAEVCEKEHRNVKRDIEKMLLEIGKDVLKFERIYFDSQNREQTEYHLPKDLTVTLITGYRADLRYKVVKRLEELEEQNSKPQLPDFTNAAVAARAWADQLEKNQEKQKLIEEMKPAADFGNMIGSSEAISTIQQFAKTIKIGPNKFFAALRKLKIFMTGGENHNLAYERFVKAGYFVTRQTGKTTLPDGWEKITYRTYITGKGEAYIDKNINKILEAI